MTEKNIFLYKLPPPAESGPLNLEGGGGCTLWNHKQILTQVANYNTV